MTRDETGKRNTKKNTAIKKFKRNGKFTGKHIRVVQEHQLNLFQTQHVTKTV
jgi:hypothetical protein